MDVDVIKARSNEFAGAVNKRQSRIFLGKLAKHTLRNSVNTDNISVLARIKLCWRYVVANVTFYNKRTSISLFHNKLLLNGSSVHVFFLPHASCALI